MDQQVVAIDGPSASGKGTAARKVAEQIGFEYLDSGSLYRAFTWAVLFKGRDPSNAVMCNITAKAARVEILGPGAVRVDGRDVSKAIRSAEVARAVSLVCIHAGVREAANGLIRDFVRKHKKVVVEGRDIGTVVFPDACLKIFLTASADERSRRRGAEEGRDVAEELARRDHIDSTRDVAPLCAADDAVVIDSTGVTADEVAGMIIRELKQRGIIDLP
jgi:CMP/dCMP kinase